MLLGLKYIQTFTYGVCFGCINTHTNILNSTHIFTGYSTYKVVFCYAYVIFHFVCMYVCLCAND